MTGNREPVAWVLNLDAEHELEARGRYVPTARVQAIVARERQRLVGTLVRPGDIVLDGPGDPHRARGMRGRAWCPTPSALVRLAAAGTSVGEAPTLAVLRSVNTRSFAAGVRAPRQGESFTKAIIGDIDELLAQLARSPSAKQQTGAGWLVRRSFGTAGRGRRRIAAGTPSAAELSWLLASLRLGPVVTEPWVRVTREYTRSGYVDVRGVVSIAAPCFQSTTHGAWTSSERVGSGEISRADDARLEEAAASAGQALAQAGYFGPFGIDAFRHRSDGTSAREVLNPLSEINARFTMDWTEGMASLPGE